MFFKEMINDSWTLFLDRDGVINHEKHEDYINTWNEFQFYDGAVEAIKIFSSIFKYIIIVTNQRGVAKGLTKIEDLESIHENMKKEIVKNGGKVDAIYFCSELSNDHPNRKPNPGMAHLAAAEFKSIDFSKSIMVGNTLSDMRFGRNIGAYTVFLPTTRPEVNLADYNIDAVYPSLISFAKDISDNF